jgi:hypothetical protein
MTIVMVALEISCYNKYCLLFKLEINSLPLTLFPLLHSDLLIFLD